MIKIEEYTAVRILRQYPAGYYDLGLSFWRHRRKGILCMHCPEHGPFDIGMDNFLYARGCEPCRGIHARGYPAIIHERYATRFTRPPRTRGSRAPLETAPPRAVKIPPPRPVGRPRTHIPSLYLMRVGSEYIKIGITTGDVQTRASHISRASKLSVEIIRTHVFKNVQQSAAVEKVVKRLWPMGVAPHGIIPDGHSEITHARYLPDILRLLDGIPNSPET
jgi:hypothetical protein